jgi:outer membrane protein TolC
MSALLLLAVLAALASQPDGSPPADKAAATPDSSRSGPLCGPLDLTTAQSLAMARSDEVAIKRADVLAAEADRSIAYAARFFPGSTATLVLGPSPEANGVPIPMFEGLGPVSSTNIQRHFWEGLSVFERLDVSIVQPLWTWGQLDAARDAAEAGFAARQLLVTDTALQIRQRVLMLFYSIELTNKLLGIAKDVEGALNEAEKKLDESLAKDEGEATQEDKYRLQIFRSDLTQRRNEGEKALQLARSGLAATLAITEQDLALKDEPLPQVEPDPAPQSAAVIREAWGTRPDLLALDQGVAAKDQQIRATRASALPQLFLAGNFSYSYAPNRTIQTNPWIVDNFNLLAIGLVVGIRQNIALPLLFAQAEKLEAELEVLHRQREGLARLVRVDAEKALTDLTAASKRLEASRRALSAGKSWFRASGMNFALNVGDSRSLIDAYTGYAKTQLDEAQSRYEYLVARGRLDQVIGRRPPEGGPPCSLR